MRSRPTLLLATCVASLTAVAQPAAAKPKVAVLGLEVTGESTKDQKATEAAKSLTRELRREAGRPNGPFELAPNSAKDLLEMKLLSDCSDEGRRCMSEIGRELGAQRLLYGKLERTRRGYAVALRLLDTESNELVKQHGEVIPFTDVSATGGFQRRARTLYARLSGASEEGALAIIASAERGTVYVDGQIRTSLSAGSARVSGLTDGVHTIAIEAGGYERFESEVNIEAGETRMLRAELISLREDPDGALTASAEGRPGGGWRIAFWSGVLVAGAAGAGWTYSGLTVIGEEKDVEKATLNYSGRDLEGINRNDENDPTDDFYPDACGAFEGMDADRAIEEDGNLLGEINAVRSNCDRGNKHKKLVNWVWIPTTATAVLFATFAYYKGYIAPQRMSSFEREAARKKRGTRVTVTPALGPNLVGAGLQLQF